MFRPKLFKRDKKIFYELDDALFILFTEKEKNDEGFLEVYEIAENFYRKIIVKNDKNRLKDYLDRDNGLYGLSNKQRGCEVG